MKICCVFNYPAHYNFPIYEAMGRMLDCDFYFGNTIFQEIQAFDTSKLQGFKSFISAHVLPFKSMLWHSGIRPIFSSRYTHYILTGSMNYAVNWIILLYAWFHKKKVFLWCHGLKSIPTSKFSFACSKLFFRHAELLMYNEYYTKNMLALGCKNESIHYIHNSLDTTKQTQLFELLKPSNIYSDHFGNSNPTVIFIGRIQRRMKTDLLVKAIAILKTEGILVNCVLVGNGIGNEIETLYKIIDETGIGNQIWFYGPSYDETVNSVLLYNADVCVAPGTIGLTAIHALTYGTPVITHNNFENIGPEFEAIIKDETGDFFEEDCTHDLAIKIKKWVRLSKEKREHVRQVARSTISELWSINYQMKVLTSVLK